MLHVTAMPLLNPEVEHREHLFDVSRSPIRLVTANHGK
jgi:hypothetical protein